MVYEREIFLQVKKIESSVLRHDEREWAFEPRVCKCWALVPSLASSSKTPWWALTPKLKPRQGRSRRQHGALHCLRVRFHALCGLVAVSWCVSSCKRE